MPRCWKPSSSSWAIPCSSSAIRARFQVHVHTGRPGKALALGIDTETPRTISSSPAPPASTTPASRRTASWSGVRASASSPRSISFFNSAAGSRWGLPGDLGLLGELTDHREHRSLHGTPYCAVGGVTRGAEGPPNRGSVEQPRLAKRLGGTTPGLGEDDARIAAGAHQRRPRGAPLRARHGRMPSTPRARP